MNGYAEVIFDVEDDFGKRASSKEWSLLLSKLVIPMPAVKTKYVDISGRDGSLDMTEGFGRVYYKNREKVKLEFDYIGEYREWNKTLSEIANMVHGNIVRITLDDDPEFYYRGRLELDPSKTNDVIGTVVFKGTLDPYRCKWRTTTQTVTVDGVQAVLLSNLKRPVIPDLIARGSVNLIIDDAAVAVAEGKSQNADLILYAGENLVYVSGRGEMTCEYQEAGL